jgi:hypothetical protein
MPPELPESLLRLLGVLDVVVEREDGLHLLRLTLSEEGPILAAVLRETIQHGAEIYGCSTRQVSLEEIYLHTLGEHQSIAEATLC